MKQNLKKTLLAAILAALVCVVTFAVRVPIPMTEGGYVNLGDAVVYLGSFFSCNFLTAFALGAGSALADVLAGAAIYAIPTFLVKTSMALLAMAIFKRSKTVKGYLLGSSLAGLLMVTGYFICESVMFGMATAALSIVGNLTQLLGGVALSVPVWFALRKVALVERATIL